MDGIGAATRSRFLEFIETLIQDERALAFLNGALYAAIVPEIVPKLHEAKLHHLSALIEISKKAGAAGFSLNKVWIRPI